MEMELPEKRFTNQDMMNQEHFSEIEKHLERQDECYKNIMSNLSELISEWRKYMDGRVDRHKVADEKLDAKFKDFKKECKEEFASKSSEWIVRIMAVGAGTWMVNQILQLIPTAKAVFDSITK